MTELKFELPDDFPIEAIEEIREVFKRHGYDGYLSKFEPTSQLPDKPELTVVSVRERSAPTPDVQEIDGMKFSREKPSEVLAATLKARQALYNAGFSGPFKIHFDESWNDYLDKEYLPHIPDAQGEFRPERHTLRDRLLSIEGISEIICDSKTIEEAEAQVRQGL